MNVNRYRLTFIILCMALTQHFTTHSMGLHMVNQTGQALRMRMSTIDREYAADLTPGAAYYFSNYPLNMTVYGPHGYCSQFYGIGMNPSVFTHLLIRNQKNSTGCHVLGFTGMSRQRTPRTIPAVAFDPNYCRRDCWNSTTGMTTIGRTNGIKGGLYATPTNIIGVGTDRTEPAPYAT